GCAPEDLKYVDNGIYIGTIPLFDDIGCLQRNCRGAPARDSGRADHRREGTRGDRERSLDVPASGFKTPTGAERRRPRQVSCRRTATPLPTRPRASASPPRLVGEIRAVLERATRPNGRLPQ